MHVRGLWERIAFDECGKDISQTCPFTPSSATYTLPTTPIGTQTRSISSRARVALHSCSRGFTYS